MRQRNSIWDDTRLYHALAVLLAADSKVLSYIKGLGRGLKPLLIVCAWRRGIKPQQIRRWLAGPEVGSSVGDKATNTTVVAGCRAALVLA